MLVIVTRGAAVTPVGGKICLPNDRSPWIGAMTIPGSASLGPPFAHFNRVIAAVAAEGGSG
ncbi:hypothetical protein A5646_02210 [Mycobacterium sp. 1245499.0]|nr:hypothetical protein A5646_02210 [Mycobacterium sp. 1245499.0]